MITRKMTVRLARKLRLAARRSGAANGRAPLGSRKTAQYNFTDPESRIMLNADKAYIQGYDAQAVVDGAHQIIVAADLTNQASDRPQLRPMGEAMVASLKRKPRRFLADAGYFSEANLAYLQGEMIEAYIPADKQRHNVKLPAAPRGRIPRHLSVPERMRRKLRTKQGRAAYALRKQIVEPVFGQIKEARGMRQCLLRSLEKARAEWLMACTAHNLLKLWKNAYQKGWNVALCMG